MLPLTPTTGVDAVSGTFARALNEGGVRMVSQELQQRLRVDGAELVYEVVGTGEPVVLIHGAFIAEAFAPLCAEPAVAARYRLVRYHRRGFAGSAPVPVPFSIAQQAADCRALLRHLGIERAHMVGHSSGGAMALQLALDAPEVVHSLALLEPALTDVPSGPLFAAAVGPARQRYQAGDKAGATDGFLRVVAGPAYRRVLDEVLPGAYAQAVADADAQVARGARGRAVAAHPSGGPAHRAARPRGLGRRELYGLGGLARGAGQGGGVAAPDRAGRPPRREPRAGIHGPARAR